MNRFLNFGVALALSAGMTVAHAASSYDVVTTWYEPDTQPNNTIFIGSFDYDATTRTVTNLQGQLSESMTGMMGGGMTWLSLDHQLVSWYDAALGGTFAAAFRNANTNTFWTGAGGNGWSPASGVAAGGVYYGFPSAGNNPGNAYALIFIPDDPLAALTQAQINKLAYADCAAGGMMGAVCMTGTSVAGYGAEGTMSGYPLSQTITAAVPEPETWGLMLAGLTVIGAIARRRRSI
ncbi:MAG: PEP-CTERM sorting domain-containing protein [Methyloversatilis sp.]|nr:PEP-CTERM sorting domain-containing protein [Methyloversatilis sp.]